MVYQMKETSVSVQNVSKKYCKTLRNSLWYGVKDIGNELFLNSTKGSQNLRKDEFWALRNVSFELNRGESLAIIGENGAGKSTLLKLLYGLIKPDGGSILINGRVNAMIELGVGFDTIMSGRENIFLRAGMLGFSQKDINNRISEIIEFSELEDFIDTPLQYYSSGMISRLSFAISVHFDSNILLVDEVLAVGDIGFQNKCIARMHNYVSNGGSLILISHNPHHVQNVCQRAILLDSGEVVFQGTSIEALDRYFEIKNDQSSVLLNQEPENTKSKLPVDIIEVEIRSLDSSEILTDETIKITVDYKNKGITDDVIWGIHIFAMDNSVCITGNGNLKPQKLKEGFGRLKCVIRRLPLLAGNYLLKIAISKSDPVQPLGLRGWYDSPVKFKVRSSPTFLNNNMSAHKQLIKIDVDWE